MEELYNLFVIQAPVRQKFYPSCAIIDPDHHVAAAEPKGAQKIDAKRDRLYIRVERRLADDVGVELKMFAEPAALLLLVTETLRDRKPFQRLLEFAVMGRHDASEGRRQLRSQRHFAFAFVGEIEKLSDDFRAAFFCVKLRRFQDRSVPFDKTVTARDFAPFAENIISPRAIVRQEIAKSRQ